MSCCLQAASEIAACRLDREKLPTDWAMCSCLSAILRVAACRLGG